MLAERFNLFEYRGNWKYPDPLIIHPNMLPNKDGDNVLYNVSHRTSSDFLDSKEFYEIMQAYRHTHLARQGEATYWFEKVKQFIRDQSKAIPLPNYKISKDIT